MNRFGHLVTIFHLVQLVQSSFRLEGAPPQYERLLSELNGGHLRLSATVVGCHIKLKFENFLFLHVDKVIFFSTGPSLVNCS